MEQIMEILLRMDADWKAWRDGHMEIVSEIKPEREEETMTSREATEARLEEAAAQQEKVPIVIPVGEPEEETTPIT
jgi:hypothetical protein